MKVKEHRDVSYTLELTEKEFATFIMHANSSTTNSVNIFTGGSGCHYLNNSAARDASKFMEKMYYKAIEFMSHDEALRITKKYFQPEQEET